MPQRSIRSTPNRQHTTALNHGWQGTLKNIGMSNFYKLEKRWNKRLIEALRKRCDQSSPALEAFILRIREGEKPYIDFGDRGFRITF